MRTRPTRQAADPRARFDLVARLLCACLGHGLEGPPRRTGVLHLVDVVEGQVAVVAHVVLLAVAGKWVKVALSSFAFGFVPLKFTITALSLLYCTHSNQ